MRNRPEHGRIEAAVFDAAAQRRLALATLLDLSLTNEALPQTQDACEEDKHCHRHADHLSSLTKRSDTVSYHNPP